MNIFQLFFVTFCGLQLYMAIMRFRRSRHVSALLFILIWLLGMLFLLEPDYATKIAHLMGIGRGSDLILYALSLLFLWGHYQHYVRYKVLEGHITTIVREIAIERAMAHK
jgi:hypothetical protein